MKIRSDFVTNSSSSSFIIGLKDELTKEKLLEMFDVSKNSVFYSMAEEMAKFITKEAKEKTLAEILDNYCEESISDLPKEYQKIFNKGFKFYEGYASNDGEAIENALCEMGIDYEDENFIFYKDGGY